MVETRRLTTLAILSALGAVLMFFEIPYLIMAVDVSDVVVLIAFFLFSWREAAFVGIMKALVHLLFKGAVGPMAVGQITAFIASIAYVVGLSLTIQLGIHKKSLQSILTILMVTLIMTVANYFFITPLWFGAPSVWHLGMDISPSTFGINGISGGYLTTIILVYVPFNIIKGSLVLGLYTIIRRATIAYSE